VNCTASARKPGAEQILTDELKGRGLRDRDLANRRKNDPFKLEIAARLRRETTLRIKDIAARMHLASSKLRTQICTPMQKSEKGNRKRNEPPDRTNLWADPLNLMHTIPIIARWLAIAVFLVTLSCSTRSDISQSPGPYSDYVMGKVYRLKVPVYIQGSVLGRFDDREREVRYRTAPPSWIQGILDPGTLLVISKIEKSRAPELGTWTDVYAEVLKGEQKGKVVQISEISHRRRDGSTVQNPSVVEIVQ